jgi:hypothetical protein
MLTSFSPPRDPTVPQELNLDVLDMERYKPTWLTARPQLRCLQYIHVTPDNRDKTVRLEEGDPNKAKKVADAAPFSSAVDAAAFYRHFDEAEGPMLQVATY